ncbi:MAG TPA: ParA family protein [Chloroflexota bacterium]|nr:ParA family protein [Chloroflexota bacterium]
MAKIVSVANPTDASGCTTTAIAIASFFGSIGARVLLVDCDANGDLTAAVRRAIGASPDDLHTGRAGLSDLIAASNLENVDLLAAHDLGRSDAADLPEIFGSYSYVVADCGSDLNALGTDILLRSQIVVIPLPAEGAWEPELARARQFVDDAWARGAKVVILPTFTTAGIAAQTITTQMQRRYPGTVLTPGIPRDRELEAMLEAGDVRHRQTPGWHAYDQIAAALASDRAMVTV